MLARLVEKFALQRNEIPRQDRVLLQEQTFLKQFSKLVQSKAKDDLHRAGQLTEAYLSAIYLRFKRMKDLQIQETLNEPRVFYRLLQEMLKDRFRNFDANLNRRRVRYKIHARQGKFLIRYHSSQSQNRAQKNR